jgi:hypothetical protein
MDIEFKKLKDRMPYVVLNTTAAREHVGEIEWKIRVVKVRARGKIRQSQTALESNTLKSVEISWMPYVVLNTTAAREHVGEIERKIRVVKVRAHEKFSTLPFLTLPKLMITKLMHFCVMWMNSFPVKLGISEKWSPQELVAWHKLDAKHHCKALFGAYCEVHVDSDITNNMEPRTCEGICPGELQIPVALHQKEDCQTQVC